MHNIYYMKSKPKKIETYSSQLPLITEEDYREGLKSGKCKLAEVPNKYINVEMIQIAICHDFKAILSIPEEYLSIDLCVQSVLKYNDNIKFIRDEFRTEEFWRTVLEKYPTLINKMNKKEKKAIDKQLARLIIEKNYKLIEQIPAEILDKELLELAVEVSKGYALSYIPDKVKTKELCEVCIKLVPYMITRVPTRILNKDLIVLAFTTDNGLDKKLKQYLGGKYASEIDRYRKVLKQAEGGKADDTQRKNREPSKSNTRRVF